MTSAEGGNSSLRNNRKQLNKKSSFFKKEWGYINAKKNLIQTTGGEIKFKQLNDYQRNLIKERIRKEQKKERRLTVILLIVTSLIFILSIVKLFPTIFNNENKKDNLTLIKEEQYLEYLVSGDNKLTKNNLDEAIIEYQNALQLYPDSKDAKYRLAIAYGYKCEQLKFDCDLGKKMVDELLLEDSNHTQELQKLDSLFIANTSEPVLLGN